MPVTYRGRRDDDGHVTVEVVDDGIVEGDLPHLVHHSPAGFSWGYLGSGPAELARSMVAHAFGGEPLGPQIYQRVKEELIAPIKGDEWEIPQSRVLDLIARLKESNG